MSSNYYSWGSKVKVTQLTNPAAIAFVRAVKSQKYTSLRKVLRSNIDEKEAIEFDLQPEVPQRPVCDIRESERICVVFSTEIYKVPEILAMRKDFPSDLLHVNLTENDKPVSLCLFEQDYRELVTTLTAELLLERIVAWLRRAALDKQHLLDQPLEPFLLGGDPIIFNPIIFDQRDTNHILALFSITKKPRYVYRVEILKIKDEPPNPPFFLALPIKASPWHARIINKTPTSISELTQLLNVVGVSLPGLIREETVKLMQNKNKNTFLQYNWVLLLELPKKRCKGGKIESSEYWAFLLIDNIQTLADKLDVLKKNDMDYGVVLSEGWEPKRLDDSFISVFKPVLQLDRKYANRLTGIVSKKLDIKITAIGAGAVGSHVVTNLARQGFGQWTIIDEDQLMPHNFARHALSPNYEGYNKAESIANEICTVLNDPAAAKSIVVDFLKIDKNQDNYNELLQSEYILDISVSQAVLRYLAALETNCPKSSVFLLQGGRYLVVLSEGSKRKIRLDDLDVQLAAASIEKNELQMMYMTPDGSPIRYAGACRDVTTVLAQDVVSIQSGIASRYLCENLWSNNPSITVWELIQGDISIKRYNVKPYPVDVFEAEGWNIRLSQHCRDLMRRYRSEKLPNETGGVLLGAIDILSQTIYVASILPSPPDSVEWPGVYIRGSKGLKKTIDKIKENTGQNLYYVGEWHTHPDGHATFPSTLDKKAHRWLVEEMSQVGRPALMVIMGQDRNPAILFSHPV